MPYTFAECAKDQGFFDIPKGMTKQQRIFRNYALHDLWELWCTHRNFLFKPLHKKQLLFLSAHQPITLYMGPNKQGKTYCGGHKVACYAECQYPDYWPKNKRFKAPTTGLVFVSSLDKQYAKAVLPKLKEWLPHPENDFKNEWWEIGWEKRKPVTFKYLPTGSDFIVVTHEVKRMTLEGGDYTWVWCDEPPPFSKYTSLLRGILVEHELIGGGTSFGELFITATPIIEEYFDTEIIQKSNLGYDASKRNPDIYAVKVTGQENRFVSKKMWGAFKRTLESDRTSKGEMMARLYGEVCTISGLCYPPFRNEPLLYFISPFVIPKNWTRYFMWDPHEGLETFDWMIWVAVAPNGQQFVYDELKSRLSTPMLLEQIKAKEKSKYHGGKLPRKRIIDAWAFNKRNSGFEEKQRSLVEDIRKHEKKGERYFKFVKAATHKGAIETGRTMIENLLLISDIKEVDKETGKLADGMVKQPMLQIFSSCVKFKEASFQHSERENKEIKGPNKCAFDCLRWLQLNAPVYIEVEDSSWEYTEHVPGND